MAAFFFAMFGIAYLLVVYVKDCWRQDEAQIEINKTANKAARWRRRIDLCPINNYEFKRVVRIDYSFRANLLAECNAVLRSLPALRGAQLDSCNTGKKGQLVDGVLEMMYNAKVGAVSMQWFLGWMYSYDFFGALTVQPSPDGIVAFFKWYESELRRNGYPEAKINPIYQGSFPIAWYFEDCGRSPEHIRTIVGA